MFSHHRITPGKFAAIASETVTAAALGLNVQSPPTIDLGFDPAVVQTNVVASQGIAVSVNRTVEAAALGLNVQAPSDVDLSFTPAVVQTDVNVVRAIEISLTRTVQAAALGLDVQASSDVTLSFAPAVVGTNVASDFDVELARSVSVNENVQAVGLGLDVQESSDVLLSFGAASVGADPNSEFDVQGGVEDLSVGLSAGVVFGGGVEGEVNVSGGEPSYSWQVYKGDPQEFVASGTITTQDGSDQWSDPDGTSGIVYEVEVTDNSNQSATDTAQA